MTTQEKINFLLEDLQEKQERLLQRMIDGDLPRKEMEKNLQDNIRINQQIIELTKEL